MKKHKSGRYWQTLDKDNTIGIDCVENKCSCEGHGVMCDGSVVPLGNKPYKTAVAKKLFCENKS